MKVYEKPTVKSVEFETEVITDDFDEELGKTSASGPGLD